MLRSRKYSFQPTPTGTTNNNQKDSVKLVSSGVIPATAVEWVGPITLRRRAKPELENERHRDISLYLSIQEVKNLNSRGRFFCEICLDRTLYARTTSKTLDSTVFWGENFDLNNLPEVSILTINLYKQRDVLKEKRYRSKGQNQFIAFVTIPLGSWNPDTPSTQWFPMQSPQVGTKTSLATGTTLPTRTFCTGSPSPASPLPAAVEGRQREVANSPVSGRFRKRSTPVSCFRSSEASTAAFTQQAASGESGNEAVPTANGKKSRTSWVPSLSMDSSFRQQQNGMASDSSQTSPKSPGSGMSAFTFHNPAMPQIRMQIRYEITEVLPLSSYDDLRQYVASNYRLLVRCLEPNLSAKQKEALSGCLVYAFEKLPDLSVFQLLVDMLEDELLKNNDPALIFRSNSIGSKAMECYMKLVGSDYLHRLLKPCIDQLLMSDDDFELDPSRLGNSHESNGNEATNDQLERNLNALVRSLDMLWQRIQASEEYLPCELRVTFSTLGRITERHCGPEAAGRLTSSFLFLRLICPAIHGPMLYGLASTVPESARVSRNLTLVAKVLQNLANLALFGEKEVHMRPVNVFVESQLASMHSFLHRVTQLREADSCVGDQPTSDPPEHHRFIDAGYEFARLARLLAAHQGQLNGDLPELTILLQSLDDQTHALSWPFAKGNLVKTSPVAVATAANEKEAKVDRKKYAASPSTSSSGWTNNSVQQNKGGWSELVKTSKRLSVRHDQSTGFRAADEETEAAEQQQPTVRQAPLLSGSHVISIVSTTNTTNAAPPPGHTAKSSTLPVQLGNRGRFGLVDQSFRGPDQGGDRLPVAPEPNGYPTACESRGRQTVRKVQTTPVSFIKDDVNCTDEESASENPGNLRGNKSFGNVFEYNDYTDGDYCGEPGHHDEGSGQPAEHCLKGATSENVLSQPRCILGESPSLDQLAEKMQEIKLILQTKRREAQQLAAGRVQAVYHQEESLDRMINEVNQLRRTKGQRSPQGEAGEQAGGCQTGASPREVSPSSSSFSLSGYSDLAHLTGPPTDAGQADSQERRCNAAAAGATRRHQFPREVTVSAEQEYPAAGQHFRCHSFRSRDLPDRQPVGRFVSANIRDPMARHGGLNLLDLSLASEGTGIPLGKLIVSNNTPTACYHHRRYPESKFIEN